MAVVRYRLLAGLCLAGAGAGVCAGQTASEIPATPTRVVQLPLSGRTAMAGDVSVTQMTAPGGDANSAITVQTMVTVPPPYSGSAATGTATKDVVGLSSTRRWRWG